MLLEITSRHLESSALGDEREDVIERIMDLNEELKKDAPRLRQMVNKSLFANGTIGAAIYISIKERTETGALEMVNGIFSEFFRRTVEESITTRSFYSIIDKIPFIGNIMCFMMTRLNEDDGWIAERGGPGALISIDFKKCGIYSYLERIGIPELCQVYCNGDDINAGYMTGLKFVRDETLAKGDDSCRFRYYKRKGGKEAAL